MPQLHKMQISGMPHTGKLLADVMKQRAVTKTELGRRMNLAVSGINQYTKQTSLHAALLWKLGEVLNYNFFAVLAREFPVNDVSDKERDLQQQLTDVKKENELYQKILSGKLGY